MTIVLVTIKVRFTYYGTGEWRYAAAVHSYSAELAQKMVVSG